MAKTEVIDLLDVGDDSPPGKVPRGSYSETRISSREGRKAANRISHNRPSLPWPRVTAVVQQYCLENPTVRSVDTIAEACEKQLMNSLQHQEKVWQDYENSQDSLDAVVDAEVQLLSTVSPLGEVLRLFPNAKRDFVQVQLKKFGNSIDLVVQNMLDNGYEKEEELMRPSPAPDKPVVDFTSCTWETSPSYRKDALSELARNFPFLTQPGLAQYFKVQKHHFYHTLVGIEKLFKIPALQFAPGKVQNILGAVDGQAENTFSANETETKSTTVASVTAHAGTVEDRKPTKTNSEIIDLLESQPEEIYSSQQKETQAEIVILSSPPQRMQRCKPPKQISLSKTQAAILRTRCCKETTGLSVKSIVMCAYQGSLEDNLSYELHPLDPVLQEEMLFISREKRQEMEKSDQEAAEKLNEELATAEGSLMECGCCYGEYAFEALVQCSEGHLFCKQCLQRYCEQTVFGNGRSALKCMNTSETCEGFFTDSMLRNSLPEKVFEKFSQALFRDALTAASVEGLVTCHSCGMQMVMGENAGNIMICYYCSKETCRLCNEASHVPLRCEEVEKKGETSTRLSVEEAMTQARLRECKKCKTRFFKTEGCNKMTCRCGANICYICRKDISKEKYAHFCQTAHCTHKSCNKCKLFTDSIEDDRAAMKEAGLQALQKQLVEEAEGAEKAASAVSKVDLDKLLEANPNKPNKPLLRAPADEPRLGPRGFAGAVPVVEAVARGLNFPHRLIAPLALQPFQPPQIQQHQQYRQQQQRANIPVGAEQRRVEHRIHMLQRRHVLSQLRQHRQDQQLQELQRQQRQQRQQIAHGHNEQMANQLQRTQHVQPQPQELQGIQIPVHLHQQHLLFPLNPPAPAQQGYDIYESSSD